MKLEDYANIASVATPIIGVCVWFWIKWEQWKKRRKMEKYLLKLWQDAHPGDRGQRTMLNVIVNVGLTESEALQASFESGCIKRLVKSDGEGFAEKILFQYYDEDSDTN